jgi:hypothetical protein
MFDAHPAREDYDSGESVSMIKFETTALKL